MTVEVTEPSELLHEDGSVPTAVMEGDDGEFIATYDEPVHPPASVITTL